MRGLHALDLRKPIGQCILDCANQQWNSRSQLKQIGAEIIRGPGSMRSW